VGIQILKIIGNIIKNHIQISEFSWWAGNTFLEVGHLPLPLKIDLYRAGGGDLPRL